MRERARERVRKKKREKTREKAREKMGEMVKRKKVKKKRAMTRGVAMCPGASQPTLALGRQTSNCHVGQDCAERLSTRPTGPKPGVPPAAWS